MAIAFSSIILVIDLENGSLIGTEKRQYTQRTKIDGVCENVVVMKSELLLNGGVMNKGGIYERLQLTDDLDYLLSLDLLSVENIQLL